MDLPRMALLAFLCAGFSFEGSAQYPDWSSTTFSASGQWIIPQREFGTYWNAGPAFGILADIPLNEPLFLSASSLLSWHSRAETNRKDRIPPVILLQLGGGLGVKANISQTVGAAFTVLIVNNAFIFAGPPVRPGLENAVESEFGVSFATGLRVDGEPLPPLSVFISFQPILVGLDPVAIVSLGLAVELK